MTQYAAYPVHPALQRYIKMYFIVRINEIEPTNILFSANPYAVLLFNFGGNEVPITSDFNFNNKLNKNKKFTFYNHQSWFGGMHDGTVAAQFAPNVNILFAFFTPIGVHHLLRDNAGNAFNQGFSFDEMGLDKKFDGLTDKLQTVKGNDEAQKLLETYFLRYFCAIDIQFSLKDMSPVADYIERQNGVVKIKQLEDKFHISRRWLEKQFVAQIGMPPKDFARITRFNALLGQVTTTPSVSWSEMIDDYGYYDHSHLIRDFHDFTGQSPTQYFKDTPDVMNSFFYSSLE